MAVAGQQAGGDLVRLSGEMDQDAAAAVYDHQVLLAHRAGEAGHGHGSSIRAASSAVLANRPLTAYWIMRFRQFGSRPSANVHHRPGSAASTVRRAAARAPARGAPIG